jgi:PST family polysaccharide transporter
LLGALGLVLAYRANGQRALSWGVSVQQIRQLMKDGWPLALAGMAVMVYMKIDQIMLGQMLGNRAVGMYSAATRISEVWYFIPISIVASVSPSLIEAKKASTELYYQRLSNLFRFMVLIALAIAVPMTFAAGYLATALYGNDYEGVGPILAIHIWAALFVFLGVAQSPWTINEGLTKLALLRTFVGAVANVFLNLLLIPKNGAIGAAIATTISYGLSAVILNAFSSKTRKIFQLQLNSIFAIAPSKR